MNKLQWELLRGIGLGFSIGSMFISFLIGMVMFGLVFFGLSIVFILLEPLRGDRI